MKRFLYFLIMISSGLYAKDDPKYPVAAIPEDLKQNVNVVYRENLLTFNILSKSRATMHIHKAITILNPNGKRYTQEVIWYDKLSKITSLQGNVYDANGFLIKRLKSNEVYDQSAYEGLYSDNRIKSVDLSQGTYPYTVEFEYDVAFRYLFFIPSWYVSADEKASVQHASYKLIYPQELRPRYKTFAINNAPVTENRGNDLESLTWEFNNLIPIKLEPFSPWEEVIPRIVAAPTVFEYDGYAGSMQSWNEYGEWVISLNKGRDVLSESTQNEIRKLTASLATSEEKVKALYRYLQNKTRYVSIQLGIGGYQPFEAAVVDKTGYGDCKALSNYMVSMLKVIGIRSHYVLVGAGPSEPALDTDFPSPQFNHAIVCVPNGKDTLWLECTSQTNPFGYMGSFTGNRKALAITETGAQIVQTPKYTAEDNLQSRVALVTLDLQGNAKAKVTTVYNGLQYESDGLHSILDNQYEDQKKWLTRNIAIPSFDIDAFRMENSKARIPGAKVETELTLNRLATLSGKRVFLTPNLMNRSSFIPEKIESRKNRIIRRSAFTDIDTIRYKVPEQLYPEYLPAAVSLTSRFGHYEAAFTMEQGSLLYVRKLKIVNGTFAAETYPELLEFYKNISKADNVKIVFLNRT